MHPSLLPASVHRCKVVLRVIGISGRDPQEFIAIHTIAVKERNLFPRAHLRVLAMLEAFRWHSCR